jgi:hypothetical protein
MATIDSETSVVIPMKHIAGIVGALLVGGGAIMWAVLTFTIGGVRDDVAAIRTDIGKLQESAAATPAKLNEAQLALSKDISGLRVDLETFHGDFKVMKVSLDDLGTKVDTLIKQSPRK